MVGKWWENGGELGETGGNWREMGKCQKMTKTHSGKYVKLIVNRRKMGQFGTNFPFPAFFHSLATFPYVSFEAFASRTSRLEKWGEMGSGRHEPIFRPVPMVEPAALSTQHHSTTSQQQQCTSSAVLQSTTTVLAKQGLAATIHEIRGAAHNHIPEQCVCVCGG